MSNKNQKTGLLLIDKPQGPTSHDMVDQVREITGMEKIGHTGTLDPQAEGLLILLIGREATKKQSEFLKLDKEYEAEIKLGEETDTLDSNGKTTNIYEGDWPNEKEISSLLDKFKGGYHQVPPAYSAKRVDGERAYKLARKGEKPELEPEKVDIYKIKLVDYSSPKIRIRIQCSKGTYIRSLARDIGKKLGCGAHLTFLRRTKIGDYELENAISLSELTSKNWQNYLKKV
ncbi:MAG: tRNA pseudouridine(55) synthase TruB [Candidatus Paceibacterota bacterium]